MYIALRQAYRHFVQQAIARQEMRSMKDYAPAPGLSWPASGITALFSAAAVCGTLAQAHLG